MSTTCPLRPIHSGFGATEWPRKDTPNGLDDVERFRCTIDCTVDPDNCLSEQLIKSHADILARPEWRSLGYQYVNIDDCWENMQRTGGKLVANSTRFPPGMHALADYALKGTQAWDLQRHGHSDVREVPR